MILFWAGNTAFADDAAKLLCLRKTILALFKHIKNRRTYPLYETEPCTIPAAATGCLFKYCETTSKLLIAFLS